MPSGDIECFDGLSRALVHHSGAHLVSVGYALAPEQKFPEGLEDAYAATQWVQQHAADFGADPDQIAVAGECAEQQCTPCGICTVKNVVPEMPIQIGRLY